MNDTGNYYVLQHLVLITGLTDRTLRSYISAGLLQGGKDQRAVAFYAGTGGKLPAPPSGAPQYSGEK